MGRTVEKKRKKKGRPSLLDLQKRSLRLENKQQQQPKRNPNPSPNPYLRFPNSSTPGRRPTRRNPSPEGDEEEEEEDDDDSTGKRREKKLKLVLRLPPNNNGSNRLDNSPRSRSGSDSAGSESDGEGEAPQKKRKIDAVGGNGSAHSVREKTERHNSALKATDPLQGEPSDSGPTTPLPDKKLLVFILDRLQKKDTYDVFSEPVDPNELPDYHEIIEHPMDFGTVRKKLSSGAYANLEQFEKDILLISSNAMRYNAPDTIYFRQARSIQELAKKNFENLRQESDDNEPETKPVRRGRPPSKNIFKQMVGRPPADRAGSDFSSDATLANAVDNSIWSTSTHDPLRKESTSDKPDLSTRTSHGLRNSESYSLMAEHKSERNVEYSGSMKGVSMRYGKKVSVLDENRRNTCKQPQPSTNGREPSVLAAFDGEKKQLVPVGLYMEHSYAKSLARFAANLGSIGWEIAAKRIQRALPPGTKFGRGWVGENDAPQPSQSSIPSTSSQPPSKPKSSPCTGVSKGDALPERPENQSNNLAVEEGHASQTLPPSASASAVSNRPSNSMEGAETVGGLNYESGFGLLSGGGGMRPKTPFQLHQNPTIRPTLNGMNAAFGFSPPSHVGKFVTPARLIGNFGSEVPMPHARAFDTVSRSSNSFVHPTPTSHLEVERPKLGISSTINSESTLPDSSQDSQGPWRGLSLHPKPDSTPPDLNVRFQSPGSPASGVLVDSQQPDLALQL